MNRSFVIAGSRLAVGALVFLALVGTVQAAEGKDVYLKNCVACHQSTGDGLPPAFPALKGSEMVNGAADESIKLVLAGKPGTAMVAFGYLSDEDLAAVLSYIRSSWGNTGDAVTADQVKALR